MISLLEIDYNDTAVHVSDTITSILSGIKNNTVDELTAISMLTDLLQSINMLLLLSDISTKHKSEYYTLILTIKYAIKHVELQ